MIALLSKCSYFSLKKIIIMKKLMLLLTVAAVVSIAATPVNDVLENTTSAIENAPQGDEDVVGLWKTIDDETGKAKSYVKIYKAKNGMYYGKITKLLNRTADEEQDPYCEVCPSYRQGQRIIGMKIITKMTKKGDVYSGGTILDPKEGKVYTCKMWAEDGDLKVRGYIGFLYRTQTWKRV
jgi:uncharacterized protein (DUF2147 family)